MKKSILSLVLLASFSAHAEKVTLNFSNLNSEKGQLAVAAFSDPTAFPDRASRADSTKFFPLNGGAREVSVVLELRPGHYALATYLDGNKNGKLDKNIVGIPKERFGFSKNPKVTVSAPNFAECEFEVVEGKDQELSIKLLKFL